MRIKTGISNAIGQFCIVLEDPEDSESASVVAIYRPGTGGQWQRLETEFDIVSVSPSPDFYKSNADFLGLTGEGTVVLLTPELPSVRIPGAGFDEPGSSNLGRMEALVPLGRTLAAIGFGGQVYILNAAGEWAPLSPDFPKPLQPQDTIKFMVATEQVSHGRLLFGGEVVAGSESSADIDAANEADDADLLVELLLGNLRYDFGSLWTFEKGIWRDRPLPTNSILDGMVTDQSGWAYLRFRDGVVYATNDLDEMNEIAVGPSATGFSSITLFQGKAHLADEENIFVLSPTEIANFEPAPPSSVGYVVDLSGGGDFLYLFRSGSILAFKNGSWTEVIPPTEIVALR